MLSWNLWNYQLLDLWNWQCDMGQPNICLTYLVDWFSPSRTSAPWQLVLFIAFPVPIIVLIGRKHVPINSHLMKKDGGSVSVKMKKKKKNQTADRCSWDRQFWLQYPGLIVRAVGKALSIFFGSLNTQNILKGNRDYRGKGGCLCIYIYPIWDSCHFILLSPKFGLLLLPDTQRILTRSPIIIIFKKKTTSFWLLCISSRQ